MRWLCIVAAALGLARPAHADRAGADQLADEANRLAAEGKLTESAAKFRAAYAEDPRPQLICNVGVAYYKANDLPRAALYLEQCRAVGGQLDAAFLDSVDRALAAVRQVLGAGDFASVTLFVDPSTAATTIAGSPFDEPITGQRSLWLPFGSYRVRVHQNGYRDHEEPLQISNRNPVEVRVKLDTEPHVVHPGPTPPPAPPLHHSHTAALAATIGTVALGALAGLAYIHAVNQNDLAAKTHDMDTYKELRSSTLLYEHLSWVAASAAVVGAAASGYLWYRSVHVEASPQQAVVAVTGTF